MPETQDARRNKAKRQVVVAQQQTGYTLQMQRKAYMGRDRKEMDVMGMRIQWSSRRTGGWMQAR